MADMGRRLEAFGADFLAIACNTAHHYYDAVQDAVDIPVIHIIETVTDQIRERFPNDTRIGILASPAVAMTGLYTRVFETYGLEDVWPDPAHQDALLDVIKAVKRGDTGTRVRQAYKDIAASLAQKGVGIAVVACTELSALDEELPVKTVDAAEVLAREIVNVAKNGKQLAKPVGTGH